MTTEGISQIGRSLWPPDDREFVRGDGTFLADVEPRDALWAVFVRSFRARGNLRGIDVAEARAMPRTRPKRCSKVPSRRRRRPPSAHGRVSYAHGS